MMYVFAIACIKISDNLVGLRLVDYESRQVIDAPIKTIIDNINNGKLTIQNVGISNGNLVGTNGSLDRYSVINPQGLLISDKATLVVIRKIEDFSYTVADYKGKVINYPTKEMIKYARKFGIANGKLVNKDGKQFISAINGEYLQSSEMRITTGGLLDKIDLVLLKSLFNPRLHDAIIKKDAANINKIIAEEYKDEYLEKSPLDVEYIYKEHQKELKSGLRWAH